MRLTFTHFFTAVHENATFWHFRQGNWQEDFNLTLDECLSSKSLLLLNGRASGLEIRIEIKGSTLLEAIASSTEYAFNNTYKFIVPFL